MTKSTRSLIGTSAVFAIGNGVSRITTYALPIIFAAWIPPAEMGAAAILMFISIIVRTVVGLGVTTSAGAVYYDVRSEKERLAVISTTTVLIAAGSALGLFCSILIQYVPAELLPREWSDLSDRSKWLLPLAFAGIALQLLSQPFTMQLQFQGRSLTHLFVTVSSALLGLMFSVWFVCWGGGGVEGWLKAGVVSSAATVVLAVMCARVPGLRWNGNVARRLIKLGWPFVPGAAFLALIQGAPAYLLARMDGLQAAGVYNVGYSIGMVMSLATTGFAAAWFPFFQQYATDAQAAKRAFSRVLFLAISGFGLASLFFYSAAPYVVWIVFDSHYANAAQYVGDVAATQAIIAVWSILTPVLYFTKRIWIASAMQGLAAMVTMIATPFFIREFGAGSAGLGALLGATAMLFAQLVINYCMNSSVGRFLRREHVFAALAILLAAALIRSVGEGAHAGTFLGLSLALSAILALVLKSTFRSWPME